MPRKIRRHKPTTERERRALRNVKAQRGLDREEFFANGGELVRWRGMKLVTVDKRKQENKKRGRQKVREW
jgi:hypothetical protein